MKQTVDINILMREYRDTIRDITDEMIMLRAYVKQLESQLAQKENDNVSE